MKSTVNVRLLQRQLGWAEGRIRLDLIDPVSRKSKERVEGKNHIFAESLFSSNWMSYVSSLKLLLTDNQDAVDENFPFITGNILGIGVPSTGSSGTIQGAYVAANQILALKTLTSTRWKFQYEFTTTQANGVIGTMGLTSQLGCENSRATIEGFCGLASNTTWSYYTADRRYGYTISTAGIISKIDLIAGTTTTIDVSATVGTSGNKYMGYGPATGYYYVYQSSTKKMYEFSDNTFSTLLNNYNASNLTNITTSPMYMYGNNCFAFSTSGVYTNNFVNNIAGTYISFSVSSLVNSNSMRSQNNTYPWGKYVVCGGTGYYSSAYNYTGQGVIFNMTNNQYYPLGAQGYGGDRYNGMVAHPYYTAHMLPCYVYNGNMAVNTATAQYVLPTPVTKTSANGMIVTYEIEVFWQ